MLKGSHSKSKVACEICNEKFNMFTNREHLCKRCKRSVCKNCAKFNEKVVVSLLLPAKEEKICVQCKDEQDFQRQLHASNRTTWNFNSKVTTIWIKFLKLGSIENARQIYDDAKEAYKKSVDQKVPQVLSCMEQVKQEVIKMYTEPFYWNYSFLEWFYRNLRSVEREEVINSMKRVVGILLHMNPEIGYSKELVQMTLFVLTLSREYVAYVVLQRIYFLVLPDTLLPSSYMTANVIPIQEEYFDFTYNSLVADCLIKFQQQFKIQPGDLPLVRKFMEFYLIQFKSTLFLNLLNLEVVFSILNESLDQQNSSVIDRYFLVIVKLNLDNIRQYGMTKTLLTSIMHTSLKDVKELCQQLEQMESKAPSTQPIMRKIKSRKTLGPQGSNKNDDSCLSNTSFQQIETPRNIDRKKTHNPNRSQNFKAGQFMTNIDSPNPNDYTKDGSFMSISQSQRGLSLENCETKKYQELLNSQLDEITKLKDLIRQKEQQIVKMGRENEAVVVKIKQKKQQHDNMVAKLATDVELIDHQVQELFEGTMYQLEEITID